MPTFLGRLMKRKRAWRATIFYGVAIVGFGFIGTLLLVRSHAATTAASVQVESGSINAPSTKVSDTTASGNSVVKFGASTSTTPTGCNPTTVPAQPVTYPGYPDDSNTGPRVASSALTTMTVGMSGPGWAFENGGEGTGLYITGPNVTIRCYNIPGSIQLAAGATHAVIEDDIISSTGNTSFNQRVMEVKVGGFYIGHNIIEGPDRSSNGNWGYQPCNYDFMVYGIFDGSGNYGADGTIEFNNIRGTNHPFNITSGTINDNYVHSFSQDGGCDSHTDAIFSGGGDTKAFMISHNTLLNDRLDYTACDILLSTAFGAQQNVTIDDNILAGGGYIINAGNTATYPNKNVLITNNKMSTLVYAKGGYYGLYYPTPANGTNGNVVSGNTWYDGPNKGKAANN